MINYTILFTLTPKYMYKIKEKSEKKKNNKQPDRALITLPGMKGEIKSTARKH